MMISGEKEQWVNICNIDGNVENICTRPLREHMLI